ncbi:thermonuclease family protein [Synechococcus sp. CS-1329]|uniref:thermonuclease family protein n=1 Tax=Synechococcus sp. CS-1329 TaxID=2847975 RepID=UPI00223AC59F|nr:thermonuclease family protein [Synechococcus sp. CS-1329]MCT0218733.1 thermonuclease family protein [Synechococcus sp. CS-1329]
MPKLPLPWPGLLVMALLVTPACTAQGIQATVLSVGDGDTIRVLQGKQRLTVRLACIDAPEMAQAPHGANSRNALQSRLPVGRVVQLNVKTRDRYGRTVAEVISSGNINLAMVASGQAFAYRQYLGNCKASDFLEAESKAGLRGLGVWQLSGGILRPWDFRRAKRAARAPAGSPSGPRRYDCQEIGSHQRAQELLRQGHSYLDGNGDGEACEQLLR